MQTKFTQLNSFLKLRLIAPSALLAIASLTFSVRPVLAQQSGDKPTPPSVSFWHLWTDKDGVSHLTKEALHAFELKSIAPSVSPQWLDKLKVGGATITVTVMPVGWVGEWHEDPHRQWMIPISGRWFIEAMDGTRVEAGPGEVIFGEDQGTKPDAKGHKGHLAGTVGSEPFVAMFVQLPDVPTSEQPTRFQ